MSRAKVIDHYLKKIREENFDVYQVRKELEKNNVDEEEIKIIVRLIDNEVQRATVRKQESENARPLVQIGIFLTVIGAGLTIVTYVGIIDMGDSFMLVYGPFFAGLSLIVAGLAKQRFK